MNNSRHKFQAINAPRRNGLPVPGKMKYSCLSEHAMSHADAGEHQDPGDPIRICQDETG